MRNKPRNSNQIIVQKMRRYCDTIAELLERFDNSFELYVSDMAFQLSCNMCIIQLGELTARLSEDFKAQYSDIPWRAIKSMRNIHAHDYDNIDFNLMWNTLTVDVPALKLQLNAIDFEPHSVAPADQQDGSARS